MATTPGLRPGSARSARKRSTAPRQECDSANAARISPATPPAGGAGSSILTVIGTAHYTKSPSSGTAARMPNATATGGLGAATASGTYLSSDVNDRRSATCAARERGDRAASATIQTPYHGYGFGTSPHPASPSQTHPSARAPRNSPRARAASATAAAAAMSADGIVPSGATIACSEACGKY